MQYDGRYCNGECGGAMRGTELAYGVRYAVLSSRMVLSWRTAGRGGGSRRYGSSVPPMPSTLYAPLPSYALLPYPPTRFLGRV
eukprot:573745-Rhodomonas_salina.1